METNFEIYLFSWLEKFRYFKGNLTTERKRNGFMLFLLFLHDILLFIFLSIFYYLILFILLTYQVNIFKFYFKLSKNFDICLKNYNYFKDIC